jgi:MFS family permease
VFGALADRYGFKSMFMASFLAMVPAYLLLSLPKSFIGFLLVYLAVAVGHGMFKPVVISTVVKSTTEKTGSMGFGIFYMMVNVGGFLGPIAAGIVRGWDWSYVFYASAGWIALNLVICWFLYEEPKADEPDENAPKRSLRVVMSGMVEVVGNARFFLLVGGLMVLLVLGSRWISLTELGVYVLAWIAVNLGYDVVLRRGSKRDEAPWFLTPMRVGETRYLVFLLLMAGFWTSFNQIFMTLPEYIRDYADTTDLVRIFAPIGQAVASTAGSMGFDTSEWHRAILIDGQVKPEFLINLNALGIIVFQVMISFFSRKLSPFTTIVVGVAVTVVSFLIYPLGATGLVVCAAILIFSVGEMLASPRSKEYAGRIAPKDKVGMYMGYFYWCVALGNLFGGLLSGSMYQAFGPEGMDAPNVMWIIFAVLAAVTAVLLVVYDAVIRRSPPK